MFKARGKPAATVCHIYYDELYYVDVCMCIYIMT